MYCIETQAFVFLKKTMEKRHPHPKCKKAQLYHTYAISGTGAGNYPLMQTKTHSIRLGP
jgi:hypothetical protein